MIYTLAHLLELAAVRWPGNEAFRSLNDSLSYAELNHKADQLSCFLMEGGLGKGDRVGIVMNRCLDTAVAVYGILKAGGAYVAINPFLPVNRISMILEDCGIEHIMTTPALAKKVKTISAAVPFLKSVVGISTDLDVKTVTWDTIFARSLDNYNPPLVLEQDLAFILYTSGSTGMPKGIMHTHYSGLSLARLEVQLHSLTSSDRIGLLAPLHFDQANFGLFSPSLVGATTVIFPDSYVKLPASLATLVAKEKISVWFSVPYILIQILQQGNIDEHDFSSLRWVRFGGEVFPVKTLRELMSKWPQARFINSYGPSELARCTYHILEKPPMDDEAVPLGRVWGNTEYRILDKQDQEVKKGEPGQLVVRTATLMAGYWNNPELTEKSYFRRKIAAGYDHVYYRTGDLVYENQKGELMFLGRIDRQTKLRGNRIELDEIEATLLKNKQVKEAAVILVQKNGRPKELEAAVRLEEGSGVDPEALLLFCKGILPPYAVPQKLTIMKDFPRTGTGKIDRNVIIKLLETDA